MALKTLFSEYDARFGEVSVLLTTDEEIRDLNQQWRGIDTATDVLSWPAPEMPGMGLGDIAISVPTAQKQADARQAPLDEEVTLLAVHGGLHLLGYDDETHEDQADMIARMQKIAEQIGLPMDATWQSLPHEGESS